jgi:hypothetical protein
MQGCSSNLHSNLYPNLYPRRLRAFFKDTSSHSALSDHSCSLAVHGSPVHAGSRPLRDVAERNMEFVGDFRPKLPKHVEP